MKYTPGPWLPSEESGAAVVADEREWFVYATGVGTGRRLPAVCTGPDAPANARLVAAAPETLAGLELSTTLLEALDEWFMTNARRTNGAAAMCAEIKVQRESNRAAIAKAGGA